jgi:hypothetical protein
MVNARRRKALFTVSAAIRSNLPHFQTVRATKPLRGKAKPAKARAIRKWNRCLAARQAVE